MFKKLFFISFFLGIFALATNVSAMTPTLSVSPNANDSSSVQLTVVGDSNAGVILYYYSTNANGPQEKSLGTTNSSGSLITNIDLDQFNITQNSVVSVIVNGQQSANVGWTYANTTATTTLALSQSSAAVSIGQSSTITASNNGTNALYLASNANAQVANISISGNQITVTGLSIGQTTANVCVINATSQNCASVYVVVTNSSQQLTFSQNNTTIISGQNSSITVGGGNGFYQVQNNSNPSIVSTSFNGSILTLYANGTTGTSTITVCSTDNSACGVVIASIGTYTSSGSGLILSQTYPTIIAGQTQTVTISGGTGTYYLASNSNTTIVQTSLPANTNSITLYGSVPGTANIVVCAPSGQCGTIIATVVSVSSGALTLSQSSIALTPTQQTSITITGGTMPYSITQNDSGIAQYSLNYNSVTITGVSQGASTAMICSAGGACVTLNVTVAGASSAVSGVQPVFGQNNISLNVLQTTAIPLSGNGGYYITNNSNSSAVSASISGNNVVLSGIVVGSANITVCQTGGQCNTLYVSVSNTSTPTVSSVPLTFSPTSVSVTVGQSAIVNVLGGSGVGYYISYNSSPNTVGVYVSGSSLHITGNTAGNGTLSVCSSANVCASIGVNVTQTASVATVSSVGDGFIFSKHLEYGTTNHDVTELQKRLTVEGVYAGPITGYFGNLTTAAVKKYQTMKGLDPIGQVGPGTRSALNG